MLQINFLRDNKQEVIERLKVKNFDASSIIDEVITATGAESIKDMGKVIGTTNAKVLGRAEGRVIADLVKSKLNSF